MKGVPHVHYWCVCVLSFVYPVIFLCSRHKHSVEQSGEKQEACTKPHSYRGFTYVDVFTDFSIQCERQQIICIRYDICATVP